MIEFSAGLSGEMINLTDGTLSLTETVGPEEIEGPSGGVTVSGGHAVGVFNVAVNVNATISGLTITQGSASRSGGGLFNSGTTTLTDCNISGNYSGVFGGGVYNYGDRGTPYHATLTLNGCTISGNSAGDLGGGVCNYGAATLSDCTISGNSATGQGGGGVNNGLGGTVTLAHCHVTGNSTSGGGGGVYVNFGTATLTNCTISGNSANLGGGVDNFATATINACTIYGNSASTYSAGLVNFSGTATLTDAIVAGNTLNRAASDISTVSGTVTGSYDLIGTGGSGGLSNGVDGNIVLTGSETARPGRPGELRRADRDPGPAAGQPRHRQRHRRQRDHHRPARVRAGCAHPDIGAFQTNPLIVNTGRRHDHFPLR